MTYRRSPDLPRMAEMGNRDHLSGPNGSVVFRWSAVMRATHLLPKREVTARWNTNCAVQGKRSNATLRCQATERQVSNFPYLGECETNSGFMP